MMIFFFFPEGFSWSGGVGVELGSEFGTHMAASEGVDGDGDGDGDGDKENVEV